MENDIQQMLIATELEEVPLEASFERRRERGLGDIKKGIIKAVGLSELKKNMKAFFDQLHDILDMGEDRIGAFEVNEVEISAQITGEGKICLMGSGTKVGVGGGFKFVLTRSEKR